MGCRAQPVRYPISRTVQQMTRETRMGPTLIHRVSDTPVVARSIGTHTAPSPNTEFHAFIAKQHTFLFLLSFNGARGRNRTTDTRIFN